MMRLGANWAGVYLELDHADTEALLGLSMDAPGAVEQVIRQLTEALHVTAVLQPYIAIFATYLKVWQFVVRQVDQGYGVYLTLPWPAVAFGLLVSPVALAAIIPTPRHQIPVEQIPPNDGPFAASEPALRPLGGLLTGHPCAINNVAGDLLVFGRGNDNRAYVDWRRAGEWTGWARVSDSPVIAGTQIAAARNRDGRIELFALALDGAVWHAWETRAGMGTWSGWESLGGTWSDDPGVAVNHDGRLEVFVRGPDGSLWHTWQLGAGGAWLGHWQSLGGSTWGTPAVTRFGDGRLVVFARTHTNEIDFKRQQSPGGAFEGDWRADLRGRQISADPTAVGTAEGAVIFGRGTDGALYTASLPGGTASWQSLGGDLAPGARVAVARAKWGNLDVMARFRDGSIRHRWQMPNGWGGWDSLGAVVTSDPAVAPIEEQMLVVVARGLEGSLVHRWQVPPGDAWNG